MVIAFTWNSRMLLTSGSSSWRQNAFKKNHDRLPDGFRTPTAEQSGDRITFFVRGKIVGWGLMNDNRLHSCGAWGGNRTRMTARIEGF